MKEADLEEKVLEDFSEEEKKIIGLYKKSNGVATHASRILEKQENYKTVPFIIRIWRKAGLKIRRRGGFTKDLTQRNKLIAEGHSIGYISKAEGICKYRVQQYIRNKTLYETWSNAINQRHEIINIIDQIALNRAKEKGFAHFKAMEYHLNRHKNHKNIPFDDLVNFYQTYDDFVKETGKPPTLKYLKNNTNIGRSTVRTVLNKSNLDYTRLR